MRKGRRRTLMIGGTLTLSGNLLLQVMIYPVFLIGYFIMSLGTGFIFVISPRFIEEIVPKKLFGLGWAIATLSANLAAFLGVLSAVILPSDYDT